MSPGFMQSVDHRPWPLPKGTWHVFQSWQDLLFAHYPVPAAKLRRHIPKALEIETFDGAAWVGVVPFYLVIRPRWTPGVPGLSFFPEINVRTYVRLGDRPGVWFFSLDATNRLAVWAARRTFGLPYYQARISMRRPGREDDSVVSFRSQRMHPQGGSARFLAQYQPTGTVQAPQSGTIEHFLAERYCLYAKHPRLGLLRVDVHHAPWPLQPAATHIEENTMAAPVGLQFDDPPVHTHFASGVDVAVWGVEQL